MTLRERLIEDMDNMVDARSMLSECPECLQNKVVYALCEYRSVNCHNDTCPYGWAEYEKQKAIFLDNIRRERDWYYATIPLTEARKRIGHRNQIAKKRKNKTL